MLKEENNGQYLLCFVSILTSPKSSNNNFHCTGSRMLNT